MPLVGDGHAKAVTLTKTNELHAAHESELSWGRYSCLDLKRALGL
jgi:hypothetical protein